MICNPIEEVINELKEKELKMTKGLNTPALVRLDDAIKALEDLEVKLWACCEAEVFKNLNNNKDY